MLMSNEARGLEVTDATIAGLNNVGDFGLAKPSKCLKCGGADLRLWFCNKVRSGEVSNDCVDAGRETCDALVAGTGLINGEEPCCGTGLRTWAGMLD